MSALFGGKTNSPNPQIMYFRKMFAYDLWAGGEFVDRLYDSWSPERRSERLLCHTFAAKLLWHARIVRLEEKIEVWPVLPKDEMVVLSNVGALRWHSLLDQLADDLLWSPVKYKNTKGDEWTSSILDILTHVPMHSAYHRGQIAADLRANGHEPPYTDFIEAVRRGYVV